MEPKKFSTIGIGVTFSPNLKANVHEASRLALMFKTRLVLIHIGTASAEKQNTFETLLHPFLTKGLSPKVVFAPGEPVEAILKTVREHKVDLLILGALQRENF
ncbi:MAG: universal stress protein, partial [Marinirhabdus sp.]